MVRHVAIWVWGVHCYAAYTNLIHGLKILLQHKKDSFINVVAYSKRHCCDIPVITMFFIFCEYTRYFRVRSPTGMMGEKGEWFEYSWHSGMQDTLNQSSTRTDKLDFQRGSLISASFQQFISIFLQFFLLFRVYIYISQFRFLTFLSTLLLFSSFFILIFRTFYEFLAKPIFCFKLKTLWVMSKFMFISLRSMDSPICLVKRW